MDNKKLRPAQGGTSIEASRWKTAEYRQMMVKKIMDTLFEHARRPSAYNSSEVKKIAESLEEKANATAKDETDYLAKISSNIRTLVASYQSSEPKILHLNSSCRGEASSAAGVEASAANMDWQEQTYQRVKRIKNTSSAKLNEIYQYICGKHASYQRDLTPTPQPQLTTKLENTKKMKKKLEDIFVQLNVTKSQITPTFKEKLDSVEKQIQTFVHNFFSRPRGQHSANVQPRLQLGPSHSRISQEESSERKPNLQVMNLQSSPLRMQSPQQNMMHLQGQSAKLVLEQEKSHTLMHQVAKESRSSPQQLNQLLSMKGDTSKHPLENLSFSSCVGNLVQQETSDELKSTRPFVIDSPGISPSPLLEEYCCNLNEVSENFSGDTSKHPLENFFSYSSCGGNTVQQQTSDALKSTAPYLIDTPGISAPKSLQDWCKPNEVSQNSTVSSDDLSPAMHRLVRALTTITPKALNASISEVRGVVCLNDRISVSTPVTGSRGTIGENLGADTNARLRERHYTHHDLVPNRRKRCCINAMPSDTARMVASTKDSFKWLTKAEKPDLISVTSQVKRRRIEQKCALLEEIREINKLLIDTEVVMSGKDTITTATAGAAEHGDGFIVKCFFRGITVNWNPMPLSLNKPLQLLIPTNYPACSPIFLDEMPVEVSKDVEDLSMKAKSKLSLSLRNRMLPLSLRDIATLWESCAREVIIEYAMLHGGGTFSSKYGEWKKVFY